MRITMILALVGLLGCDGVVATGQIRDLLVDDPESLLCTEAKPGAAAITEPCGVDVAPGVGCYTCRTATGDVAGCAWADDMWCVASCGDCPR